MPSLCRSREGAGGGQCGGRPPHVGHLFAPREATLRSGNQRLYSERIRYVAQAVPFTAKAVGEALLFLSDPVKPTVTDELGAIFAL